MIIRDEEGLVMEAAMTKFPGSKDVLMAEAHAMIYSTMIARDCGFKRVLFESDCERLVRMIEDRRMNNRSFLGQMIKEIWSLQFFFDICQF